MVAQWLVLTVCCWIKLAEKSSFQQKNIELPLVNVFFLCVSVLLHYKVFIIEGFHEIPVFHSSSMLYFKLKENHMLKDPHSLIC